MSEFPSKAYDLLDEFERECVDDYLIYVKDIQKQRCERITLALQRPLDQEYVRRSRGVLLRPLVRAALAEKIRDAGDQEDLSPLRVIRELSSIAFSNQHDFFKSGDFGELQLRNIDEIPREKMAAVSRIKIIPSMNGEKIEVTLHEKLPALKVMAELMGLVAPDRPPPLEGYTKQEITADKSATAPDKLYAELLENV